VPPTPDPAPRPGRRTKLTPEIQTQFLTCIRNGATITAASAACGITDSVYRYWRTRAIKREQPYLSFFAGVARASAELRLEALDELLKLVRSKRSGLEDKDRAKLWLEIIDRMPEGLVGVRALREASSLASIEQDMEAAQAGTPAFVTLEEVERAVVLARKRVDAMDAEALVATASSELDVAQRDGEAAP
jgi:hypothetical protein